MIQKIGVITLLVNDLDEAIAFYTEKLSFELRNDVSFGNGQRWVTVSPRHQKEVEITLVLADTDDKKERVGSQAANHVFLVVQSDDVHRDFEELRSKGVRFLGEPRKMPWGTEVVFEDLYGNRFDLLQANEPDEPSKMDT